MGMADRLVRNLKMGMADRLVRNLVSDNTGRDPRGPPLADFGTSGFLPLIPSH